MNPIKMTKARMFLVKEYLIATTNPDIATSIEFTKQMMIRVKAAL